MTADQIRNLFSVKSMTETFESTKKENQGNESGMAILASLIGQLHILALGEIAAQLAELNNRMERYYPAK